MSDSEIELHPVVRDPVEIRGQLRKMGGDLHHSDLPLSNQDRCAGEMMAYEIGDLYIDHLKESPVDQWAKVMRALRAHGYKIFFPCHSTQTESELKRQKKSNPTQS